eukprot:CAMPEP_0197863058 /NCGR_PEP_ID=MMETSP1438-20131217/40237_1 /TAXON_ID=1461541 /ORGANISM="Pterosperma sp., Strain CCMP1384" /LENGTH=408 /DNA_ID=CAMNT_0043480803 /DNA_START=334 /DNA_END=1557 /DNA_ORIENTATION=+
MEKKNVRPTDPVANALSVGSSRAKATRATSDPADNKRWGALFGDPDWNTRQQITRKRSYSSSDGQFLRRKGHLKEQDKLIEFMIELHRTHSSLEVMQKMERWVLEHHKDIHRSQLRRLVPTIGRMYHPLPLQEALATYDEFAHITQRLYVPPNFAEIRHILNIAQLRASSSTLELITFDADGTLYEDGCHFEEDNRMIDLLTCLLARGIHVGIVTAAGYPGEAHKYEQRLAGLLAQFKAQKLPPHLCSRFHIMGGECNYLLRIREDYRLEFVDDDLWVTPKLHFKEEDVEQLLNDGQRVLVDACNRLRVPHMLIRKSKAVGVVPTEPTIYEVLEELCLSVQMQVQSNIPFCAFNGGNDVFVDVGNKRLGIDAMKQYVGAQSNTSLHVGDRFTETGNDSASRTSASILW